MQCVYTSILIKKGPKAMFLRHLYPAALKAPGYCRRLGGVPQHCESYTGYSFSRIFFKLCRDLIRTESDKYDNGRYWSFNNGPYWPNICPIMAHKPPIYALFSSEAYQIRLRGVRQQ